MQTQTSNTLHNAIMEAGSKDRSPMLAPGNYVQWKSRIKRYIDTKPNHELIHYYLENPPYKLDWQDIEVLVSEESPITTTVRIRETYQNVSQDIRDQLNAEAEAVQIILTGIDNDIYSTVDACLNACETWKAIERLKQGESINVQDLETNLYWEFGKFTSQDETSKDKEIDKLMALISLSFKKIYKPTNNNLRTSSNTSRASQDNSPRINRNTGYENQRIGNISEARENVGSSVVQKSGIQCYKCKEFGYVARECQKLKRAKDAAYHREKMLLYTSELNFFFGLQVIQKEDGIFLSHDKYIGDILKKFGYSDIRSSNTPMDKDNPWGKDGTGKDVDLHLYRSMIGSLMYLTASRPDIMFAVCVCARHQVTPKECHLHAVKRIFRYLKGHPKLGLWYPKASSFDLVAYSDSDYGGASQDRKSTTGGSQFLGRRLISWQCKKQTIVATSTTEAEYVAAASCCGQVL
nr:hypothetical protein [Tanacetum cinerariifolium]